MMFRKKESDTEITELLIIISPETLTVAQVKKNILKLNLWKKNGKSKTEHKKKEQE